MNASISLSVQLVKEWCTCSLGRGFGVVVRAAGWHAGDPGSILGMDSLYTFGLKPQHFESALAEKLC
jgi:hypothetical protein